MWAVVADYVAFVERREWKKKFGTEFTGQYEGRPIRFAWHERVVGHICVGADPFGLHLKCHKIVTMDGVWLRGPKPAVNS